MFKTVTPSPSANNYYDLEFASPIYTTSSSESVMTSTSFLINGIVHYFADTVIPNSNDRRVYMYKVVNGNRTTVVTDAGRIYTTTGRLVINNFRPDDSTAIIFTVTPNSNDLAPKRNQLLSISMTEVAVTGEVDTIAVSGSAGTVNYTTTSRHK
jgi:hypothetical protein